MKKLQFWADKFKSLEYDFNALKKYGFARKYYDVYISKKHNVVIKIAYITSKRPTKVTVPSIVLKRRPYCLHSVLGSCLECKYVIQYYCKPIFNQRKLRRIEDEMYSKFPSRDVKKDNIGLYRNKPVLFDW